MTNEKANGAVTTKTDKLPAMNFEDLEKFAGTGLEAVTQDDLPTARLKVLQNNSDKELEEVKGAKPGLIYNNASNSVYGSDGVEIVVCGYEKKWYEWKERGTGSGNAPVNEYLPHNKPRDAVRGDDGKFRLPSGNYLEETANFFVLVIGEGAPQPAILSMKVSGLKVARSWAYSLKNEFIQNPKTKKLFLAPSWYRIYNVSSFKDKNDKGSWYGWKIEKGEFLNDENIFNLASEFHDSIRKGKVVAGYEDEEGSSQEQSGDIPF